MSENVNAERKRDIGTAQRVKSFRRVFNKIFQFLSRNVPGVSSSMRVRLQAWRGVKFVSFNSVFIGDGVYMDDLYPELITIGYNARITADVKILTHFFDTRFIPQENRPFRFYKGRVTIGNNVFIGTGAVIAAPVIIGDGAVIGANSVVTRDVTENTIVAGVPAVPVGVRTMSSRDV